MGGRRGHAGRCLLTADQGQVPGDPKTAGPARHPDPPLSVAPHRHGPHWYLCDRSYTQGHRRHLIREGYGKCRPRLYQPELRSGIAEDILPRLRRNSFDLAYLDPPYGTTSADWDRVPSWDWLGVNIARVLCPTGQVVLHGAGAMAIRAASAFMDVGLQHRFQIVWVKGRVGGPIRSSPWLSDYEPLRAHEMLHVFKRKDAKVGDLTFNLGAMHRRGKPWHAIKWSGPKHHGEYPVEGREYSSNGWHYPVDVVFSLPSMEGDLFAAKPEDLVTLLVATLTKPGDTILDPYAGSGTTLRVAHKLGRRSVGIEASPKNWKVLTRNLAGLRDERPHRLRGRRSSR
ncbi:MAG TPA: site-specific DNA-methyltransferase [Thermoplasmata archaeon]|nr:site-specific DNA-methyltransferase [Thermoplasmata archaeon]HEV2316690.1 site-specific DNA-methyltransferase [Thermoplasmata archaeon]